VKPDFQRAATKAAEILVEFDIRETPITPFPILKKLPNVRLVPFAEIAHQISMDREQLIDTFGSESRAAITTMIQDHGEKFYIVAYSQFMPTVLTQRALARELGHIVLEHDGSRPVEVRMAEAYCFAHHLLTPRAVIKMLQDSPHPFTIETMGSVTGCYKECLERMKQLPGVSVPAELNRKIKEQFTGRMNEFFRYQSIIQKTDTSEPVDIGSYMDGYEE